jgi:hypothetical protein
MTHKRSKQRMIELQHAHEAFKLRKAAMNIVERNAFSDHLKNEQISRTSRVEVMNALSSLQATSGVPMFNEIDVSQVPDTIHGEVLRDAYGRGTFQKNTNGEQFSCPEK